MKKQPHSLIKPEPYKALLKRQERRAQIGLFTKPIWRKTKKDFKIIESSKN